MKIGIVGSMQFVDKMISVKKELEKQGHQVFLTDLHQAMLGKSGEVIEKIKLQQKYELDAIREFWRVMQNTEAILVLNYDKNGIKNYIGGNTFLEMSFAHVLGQKIFLWNPLPTIPYYYTEMKAMNPIVIHSDLKQIK